MSIVGNAILWLIGCVVEGVIFYVVMRSVRRAVRRINKPKPRRPALRGELIPRRPELPAPPQKELTGG